MKTKPPSSLAQFLSTKTSGGRDLFYEAIEKMKADGFTVYTLPPREEMEKQIHALEKKK